MISINSNDKEVISKNGFYSTIIKEDGKPAVFKKVQFLVNGVMYNKVTDKNGEAKLNIRLDPGDYYITTLCEKLCKTKHLKVLPDTRITTRMEGTEINKTFSDSTSYQCAIYDEENNRLKHEVAITVNGVTYNKTADAEGLYKLAIRLNPGTYLLKAQYRGNNLYKPSSIENHIVVIPDPKKPKIYNPIKWMKQPDGYTCGPTALAMCSQILGKPITISQFKSACKTNYHDGTSPNNLINGAKSKGFKLTPISRNINGVKSAIDNGKPVIAHVMTKSLKCLGWVNNYGHYIVIYNYKDGHYNIADPTKGLGSNCSYSTVDAATGGRDIKYYSVDII